jgi:predicted kinase
VAARLVLICGLPGAGKTTLARRLAAELPAARLCPDEWLAGLGADLFDEPLRARLEATLWRHGRELLGLGLHVVLEFGFWSRAERDAKLAEARELGVGVELRALDPPLAVLWERVRRRNASGDPNTVPLTRENLVEYRSWFEPPDAAELARFDPPLLR